MAALLVMLGHLRMLFFVPWEALDRPGPGETALYAATALGHQAVIVFFVLSGLLISGSVLRAMAEDRWSWRWYLTQRLTRLYVVLLPALLLGFLWDHGGIALFGVDGVYGGTAGNAHILPYSTADRVGLEELLGNALFLQEVLVSPLGSNGVLWTLSYEFWYYLLFPCLVLLLRRSSTAATLLYSAASAALLLFVGRQIAVYFGVWLLGVAVTLVLAAPHRAGRTRRGGRWMVVWELVFLASLLAPRLIGAGIAADLLTGAACGGLIGALARAREEDAPYAGKRRGAHVLSSFSYTLYLVHLPALVFLQAWLLDDGARRWQPSGWPLLAAAGIAVVILLYAWMIASVTEARTDAVRRAIARRFPLSSSGRLPWRGVAHRERSLPVHPY